MKLIRYRENIVNYPDDRILRNKLKDNTTDDSLVLASDKIPSRATRSPKPDFAITPEDEANLQNIIYSDPKLAERYKEYKDNCLITIFLRGLKPTSLSFLTEGADYLVQVLTPVDKYGDYSKNFTELPEGIRKAGDSVGLFSVGRVNGPTDKVTWEDDSTGVDMKYDVNGRISMSKDGYLLTYTFKKGRETNMAKLILPNYLMKVIMQKDFDLFLMGIYVLTRDAKNAAEMFNELIEKFK